MFYCILSVYVCACVYRLRKRKANMASNIHSHQHLMCPAGRCCCCRTPDRFTDPSPQIQLVLVVVIRAYISADKWDDIVHTANTQTINWTRTLQQPHMTYSGADPGNSVRGPSLSPLRSRVLLNHVRGLGERCKLPQQGPGRRPGRKLIWCTLKLWESHWWQSFWVGLFWSACFTAERSKFSNS